SVHREVGDGHSAPLKEAAGVQHGRGLDDSGADVRTVAPGSPDPADEGPVVGLASTAGEDDLVGGAAEEVGYLLPGTLDGLGRGPAVRVIARRVAEVRVEEREQCVAHLRQHRRGGVVVEIDWRLAGIGAHMRSTPLPKRTDPARSYHASDARHRAGSWHRAWYHPPGIGRWVQPGG